MVYRVKIKETNNVIICLTREDHDSILEDLLGEEFVIKYNELIRSELTEDISKEMIDRYETCECGDCKC